MAKHAISMGVGSKARRYYKNGGDAVKFLSRPLPTVQFWPTLKQRLSPYTRSLYISTRDLQADRFLAVAN